MELEHSFTVPVPRDRAFDVLLDVQRVAPCMPGATLDSVDGDVVTGKIKVKVGPIAMTYAGTARFTDRDPAAGVMTLEASGKETRGAGTASASVRSVLEERDGETHVTVHTNLNVTGKPAQFGRGVLAEVGGKVIGIFAANLAQMLAADQGSAAGENSAAEPNNAGGQSTAAGHDSAAGQDSAAAETGHGRQDELALPLEELSLSLRSYNSLRRDGVHTVGELAARTAQELLAIENIGPASVEEIRHKLAARGLVLAGPSAAGGEAGAPQGTSASDATARSPASADLAGAGPAAAAPAAGGPPRAPQAAAAPAASPAPPAASATRPAWAAAPQDDAINLISVAGLPVLKRAAPLLAALIAAVLVVLGARRLRHRRPG